MWLPTVATALSALLERQTSRLMRLSFPNDDGPSAVLLPEKLVADEALSRDFEYTLTLISEDAAIPAKSLIGKMATIELVRRDGGPRYFNGYVFEFGRISTDGGIAHYRMVLRPWMAFLHFRQNSGPIQQTTIAALTDEILGRYQFHDYRTQLGSVPDLTQTAVMQWGESDANFLHRWWEVRGWYYGYEHRADGHTLVLCDDSAQARAIDGRSQVRYFTEGGPDDDDAIAEWSPARRLSSTHYSVSSFDFKNPQRPLTALVPTINQQGDVPELEVYEHTGAYGFRTVEDGEQRAKLSMEAIEAKAKHYEGRGNSPRLQPNRHFDLIEHFEHDQDAEDDRRFFVVRVRHEVVNNHLADEPARYSNVAVAIRQKVPWRPGRGYNSAWPRAYGLHSAVVVGPEGEEIDCDQYGRVAVQFLNDRVGQYDEKSYYRVRVATPMGGDRFGFQAVPRIGQEVIIQFLDGDPDRPMITGVVPNQQHMPPWTLPNNKTQTGILTRSTQGGGYENANALRFEDKKGEEQVWLHAEKNQDIEVENDESHWVGNDRKKTIDRDETVYVKRDRTETVDRNENITVHNDRQERVDHNERISIGDNRTEDVGQNEKLSIGLNRTKHVGLSERSHIGNNQTINIGRFKSESIGMASLQNVGLGKMTNIGMGYNRNVGMAMISVVGLNRSDQIGKIWSMSAGDKIELKVGSSQLTLTPDAIYLTAKTIHLKAQEVVHADAPKDIHLNSGTAQPAPGFDGTGGAVAGVAGAALGIAGMAGSLGKDHQRIAENNAKAAAPDGAISGVLDRTAPAPAAGAAAPPAPVTTGLGADVDRIAADSPALQSDLQALQADRWTIEYGPAGRGSYADRDANPPVIVIDGAQQGNAAQTAQTLSHEVGHAMYDYQPDFSTKDAYVNGALADEGAATLNNIKVQREILNATQQGTDIGIAGNSSNHAAYNAAYEQFLVDGDAAKAREAIGGIFGTGEKSSVLVNGQQVNYHDYYGDWYDHNSGP
ncbi:type VI secretion system tip protein TssI/VgrG [Xanthomonas fragariae]|uniref:Rhs element Vgr protein n=1 Tax=Xanthomonas fragariae TaxID=48664 RepID=A0A1Y6HG87_9XANT|nr:type VI secretion system tip protein TssI/VgrG [Xanthomonas fragariae]MDM7553622.1 type VI secretion system tip protein TssI/VgrG [Xanthomonas fragariae]MDM7556805.1 type VI secretion system tip protein TssI/VgrG [Xanthomonas fragariae]MDM7571416.1 type VI secretion system tip protein TssI/VgrG [Xanthomonas fragariae]MDM7574445.1 type VI secretion system tip protein TssI/VgrG [Xanthomonas fragariae]MDM7580734.1 type VI secretion system tip protein TssI/VgrG [Xanthomonas fragariae]